MKVFAVIGKNYGDEGKGHATAYLASQNTNSLVIKHNGGAQAGHTVEFDDKRFIFHQLGSGSFAGSPTFLSNTFLFDPLKITEEYKELAKLTTVPDIYVDLNCRVVTVYDVLVNQYIEEKRGNNRHGSCGMGIWETVLRNRSGKTLLARDIYDKTESEIMAILKDIRDGYCTNRINEKYPENDLATWRDNLFYDDVLLLTASAWMMEGMNRVKFINKAHKLVRHFDTLIFEGAQGLLLDGKSVNQHFSTPSNTGIKDVADFCDRWDIHEDIEAYYVTRTYLTRHGAGPFDNECSKEEINSTMCDLTNKPNPYQETLRYGKHTTVEAFMEPIIMDLKNAEDRVVNQSLYVTHLNETNNEFISKEVNFSNITAYFKEVFVSNSPDFNKTKRIEDFTIDPKES